MWERERERGKLDLLDDGNSECETDSRIIAFYIIKAKKATKRRRVIELYGKEFETETEIFNWLLLLCVYERYVIIRRRVEPRTERNGRAIAR